jgi:hypothetical protein
MALLCNSDNAAKLDPLIVEPLIESWTGVKVVARAPQQSSASDYLNYQGVYELNPFRAEVLARNGALVLRLSTDEPIYDNSVPKTEVPLLPLRPVGDHVFEVEGMMLRAGTTQVRFVPGPNGRMRFFSPWAAHLLARLEGT